jgi:hypothetical protein
MNIIYKFKGIHYSTVILLYYYHFLFHFGVIFIFCMKIFYHHVSDCACNVTNIFLTCASHTLLMNVMPLTVTSSVSFLPQYEQYEIEFLKPEQQPVQKCCGVIDLQKNMQLIVWSFNVEYNNMITHVKLGMMMACKRIYEFCYEPFFRVLKITSTMMVQNYDVMSVTHCKHLLLTII